MGTENSKVNELIVVEVGIQSTKMIRLQSIGQTFILHDYSVEGPLFETDSQKIDKDNLSRLADQLGSEKNITVVINDAASFNMAQKVPVATEEGIRTHLQQSLSQSCKIDLTKHFWSVTGLATGFDDQKGLTEALSNKLNVLLSATRRETIEELRTSFKKAGVEIEHVVFHVPSLVKAFEFYSDTTFEDQIVGLLDLNHDRYSLGFVKNGGLVSFRETKFTESLIPRNHMQTEQEIKTSILATETRYHAPVKCVFVSGNYNRIDLFINELRDLGCYARQWNAARKLSISMDQEKREQLAVEGGQLDSALGGALLTIESLKKNITDLESAFVPESSRFNGLVQPLALAVCILIGAFVAVFNLNWFAGEKLKREMADYSHQQPKALLKEIPLPRLNEQVDELEWFTHSRHNWLSVIAAIKNIKVNDVALSQIRITDTLGIIDPSGFDTASNKTRKRKTCGELLVEARNEGGVATLGTFIDAVKTNHQVRPLLNKRTTVRILNNVSVPAKPGTNATLFTVEYLLEEKLF